MKMKRIHTLLFLSSFITCFAQESVTDKKIHFLQQPYESLVHDIHIIQKCYLKKSVCNKKEQKDAQWALGRMGIRAAALLLALKGLSVGYEKLSQHQKQRRSRTITALEAKLFKNLYGMESKLDMLLSENEQLIKGCEKYKQQGELNEHDIQSWIGETFNRRMARKDVLKTGLEKIELSPGITDYANQLKKKVAAIEKQLQQIHDNYIR